MEWAGFKELTVTKIVTENEQVKSFYLEADDGYMPTYKAGQFLPIQVEIDGAPVMRRYTLSGNPCQEGQYRLTIKREKEGLVSRYFYDEVKVGDKIKAMPPFGKFFLEDDTRPVVLLGGGIGVTPMLSMLYRAVADKREVHFVYGVSHGEHLVLMDEINQLHDTHPFTEDILITRPKESDAGLATFEGRISKEWMEEHLPMEADFYFCGPVGFMETIKNALDELNIPEERVHYEFFGKKAF